MVNNELIWRLSIFVVVLLAMLFWERYRPKCYTPSAWQRRLNNLVLLGTGTILARVVLPVTAVGAAVFAHRAGWGLFNILEINGWFVCALSFVALDLAVYTQHVMLHTWPFLWRLHRVHHTDRVFDATTALRFHPLEIIISACCKMFVIITLGIPVTPVIFFEIALSSASLFNHGNVRIPATLERVLRFVIVTPDMHRIHHSAYATETNSNYGFNLPWWDHLFGTYTSQPAAGYQAMRIGLTGFSGARVVGICALLAEPFKKASV